MIINRITTKEGETRWEVYGTVAGRGSKYVRRRFDKKIDAENFVSEHEQQRRENESKPKTLFTMAERTFEDESRFWLAHRGVVFSPGHMRRAKDALEKRMFPLFGRLALDQVTPLVLSNYRLSRLKEGVKPSTVNRETEVAVAILNFSVKQRRIPYNPASGFIKLEEVREDIVFWEKSQAAKFLKAMDRKYPIESDKRWVYVAYLTALNTGLRAGELWGLQPKDVGDELLHVQRQYNTVAKALRSPKGKKSRYVPCNPMLKGEITRLIERKGLRADETIFQTATRSPIDHDNFVARHFEKDVSEAGVPRVRFHDLRHTATTLMIASGLDIKTVQEICGHKDIATTMRYVHLLGDSVKKAARAFSVLPESGEKEEVSPTLSEG